MTFILIYAAMVTCKSYKCYTKLVEVKFFISFYITMKISKSYK